MSEEELIKYLRTHTAQEAERDLEQNIHDELIQLMLEDDVILDDLVKRYFQLKKSLN